MPSGGHANGGARPASDAIKLARGNPGHERLDPESSVTAPPGWPPEPAGLDAIGKAKWLELAQLLEGEQRLTLSDGPMLEGAALAYQTLMEIKAERAELQREKVKDHARLDRLRTSERLQWMEWRRFLNDMCLSAGTRGRAKVGGRGKVTTKLEEWQKRRANIRTVGGSNDTKVS